MSDEPSHRFSWSAHPARERVGHAVGAVAIVAALATGTALLGGSPWWALLSLLILGLALNRFFLPSRYAIDDEGITARLPLRTVRYRWKDLRRFGHDSLGGHLSTRARQSFMDGWSGLPVLFGSRPDDVVEQIEAHLAGGRAQ